MMKFYQKLHTTKNRRDKIEFNSDYVQLAGSLFNYATLIEGPNFLVNISRRFAFLKPFALSSKNPIPFPLENKQLISL